MQVLFINPNIRYLTVPNIGLAYVISSVEYKHRVSLLDLTFSPRDYLGRLKDSVNKQKPDVVGISVNSFTLFKGLEIAGAIKKILPKTTVVFGGTHPTIMPEESIAHPFVDAICIGEGEEAFPEYLDSLEQAREPSVEGIWYKDSKGVIVRNRLRPFNQNLDALPFPNWNYWEIDKYLKTSFFFTAGLEHFASRGCPYECSFCSSPVIRKTIAGKYYRVRSAGNIIKEIKNNIIKYKEMGLKNIIFVDEVFGLDGWQLRDFCGLYKEEGLSEEFPWVCQTRVEAVTRSWAELVSKAGCVTVDLGIESGNDSIRKVAYKKQISREQITAAINNLRDNGLSYRLNFILGAPQETRSTLAETLRILEELRPVGARFSILQPLPKTEISSQFDAKVIKDSGGLLNFWDKSRVDTAGLIRRDLDCFMWKMRLKKIWRCLKLGFKAKKLNLIAQILEYLFSWKKCRVIPLTDPCAYLDLMERFEQEYILEKARNRKQQDKSHGNCEN